MNVYWIGILVYGVIVMIVGLTVGRKVKTASEYWVGGHTLKPIMGGATMAMGWLAAATIIGAAGTAGAFGYVMTFGFIYQMLSLFIAVIVIAPRLRRAKVATLAEYLSNRYYSKHFIRVMVAAIVFLAYAVFSMTLYKGFTLVCQYMLGIPLITASIIFTIIYVIYSFSGGLLSIAWADTLNIIIVVATLIVGVPLLFKLSGGFELANLNYSVMEQLSPGAHLLSWYPPPYAMPKNIFPVYLAISIGFIAYPHVVIRYAAMEDVRATRKATFWLYIFVGITTTLCHFMGIASRQMFPKVPDLDLATILAIAHMLPIGMAIGMVVAIIALVLTTMSSTLHLMSSAIAYDILALAKPNLTEESKIKAAKITMIIVSISILVLALSIGDIPWMIGLYALTNTIYVATFLMPLLGGCLWKRATKEGMIVSVILGGLTLIVCELFKPFSIATIYPVFIITAVSFVLVSVVTPKPPRDALVKAGFHEKELA